MRKVFLYYWHNEVNVGDFASKYVVSHVALNKVVEKNPFVKLRNIVYNLIKFIIGKKSYTIEYWNSYLFNPQRVIFAIGSILDFATSKCIVWGSGFREYNSVTTCRNILAVRGYLSLKRLSNIEHKVEVGDPALLLPLIYNPNCNLKLNSVSFVPHYQDYNQIIDLNFRQYNIIKTQTENIEDFIDKICSSKFILSSSLHGVIIAHAYKIPALWVHHGNVGSSDFKYYDYFSSVQITSYPTLKLKDIINYSESEIVDLFEKYKYQALPNINIVQLQKKLLSCAPFKIKDHYKQYII